MRRLRDLQRDWEGLAREDPMWAICTDPARKGRRWDPGAFFDSGEREVATVLDRLSALALAPDYAGEALDFGCGIGRLTQALARRFAGVCGVDIAPAMVAEARRLNRHPGSCRYLVNDTDRLPGLPDGAFAFAYSSIVLQHMPPRTAEGYLAEMVRVLRPGGILVFQVPERRRAASPGEALGRLRERLALGTRLRRVLGSARGGWRMQMHGLPEARVRRLLAARGAELRDVACTNSTDPGFNGELRYLEAAPEAGWISRQYAAVKA